MISVRRPASDLPCHGCALHQTEPVCPATFVLEGETEIYKSGIALCDAHAIRMWQALSAMLVMGDEPLLKLATATRRTAPVPTARGKRLL